MSLANSRMLLTLGDELVGVLDEGELGGNREGDGDVGDNGEGDGEVGDGIEALVERASSGEIVGDAEVEVSVVPLNGW